MRHSAAEKMEIIRLVEESPLAVRRTLIELDVARSTFYSWYQRYITDGYAGLENRKPGPRRFWNRCPFCIFHPPCNSCTSSIMREIRPRNWCPLDAPAISCRGVPDSIIPLEFLLNVSRLHSYHHRNNTIFFVCTKSPAIT